MPHTLGGIRDSFSEDLKRDALLEKGLWEHTRPDPFKG